MNPVYKFTLSLELNGLTRTYDVNPSYTDAVAKEYTLQTNEKFFRETLSGKLTFQRRDYDIIRNANFETLFILKLYISYDGGLSYTLYWNGRFSKTDCTINEDDKTIVVAPTAEDGYTNVLSGIEKEFDLIKLKPEMTAVKIWKRSLIQVYVMGESVVSCFLSGMYWEQDCDVINDDNELQNTYHFQFCREEHETRVYSRILCDVSEYQGQPTLPLPYDDMVGNNRNYHYAIKRSLGGYISFSNNTIDTPTEWGIKQPGIYYTTPTAGVYYPIGRSHWGEYSIWLLPGGTRFEDEPTTRKAYIMRDTMLLSDVIKVLLREIAPELTHEATPEYSHFLYDATNPISGRTFSLLLTQKSNALAGNYSQPAQKAPITLKQITDMLRDCFNAYWFVDDGKFKIEHIKWFKNGGSYTGQPSISHDLTHEYVSRNGKAWSFATNEYTYTKSQMPERYQFGWMDDGTSVFDGQPIEVLSRFVNAGSIEEINVSNFTSDIDYMLLNPGSCSEDGFALFAAVIGAESIITPDSQFYTLSRDTYRIYMINQRYVNNAAFMTVTFQGLGRVGIEILNPNNTEYETVRDINITGTTTVTIPLALSRNKIGFIFLSSVAGVSMRMDDLRLGYELPFVPYTIPATGEETLLQNGLLSFAMLQADYLLYDMPAWRIKVNGIEQMALGIQRGKEQQLRCPMYIDPNPMQLIKTHLGNSAVAKLSVNLSSRNAQITLNYDTTEQ